MTSSLIVDYTDSSGTGDVQPNSRESSASSTVNRTDEKMIELCQFFLLHAKNIKPASIRSALENRDFSFLNGIKHLNLQSSKISSLPDAFDLLPNLTLLDLSHNRLSSLPNTISRLQKLATLKLDGNQFTAIPNQLKELRESHSLRVLYLFDNPIKTIPISYQDCIVATPRTFERWVES